MFDQEADIHFFRNNNERDIEKFVGIEAYATSKIGGIGGEYKANFKDFIVREIDYNGKTLDIGEDYKTHPFSMLLLVVYIHQ